MQATHTPTDMREKLPHHVSSYTQPVRGVITAIALVLPFWLILLIVLVAAV
jgi:hypothetical protein